MHLVLNIWGSWGAFYLVYGGIYAVGSVFKDFIKITYYAVITTKHVVKMIITSDKGGGYDNWDLSVLSLIN